MAWYTWAAIVVFGTIIANLVSAFLQAWIATVLHRRSILTLHERALKLKPGFWDSIRTRERRVLDAHRMHQAIVESTTPVICNDTEN